MFDISQKLVIYFILFFFYLLLLCIIHHRIKWNYSIVSSVLPLFLQSYLLFIPSSLSFMIPIIIVLCIEDTLYHEVHDDIIYLFWIYIYFFIPMSFSYISLILIIILGIFVYKKLMGLADLLLLIPIAFVTGNAFPVYLFIVSTLCLLTQFNQRKEIAFVPYILLTFLLWIIFF